MIPTSEVTVAIPAYNVEEYLGTCLESVIAHGGRESKICVVDDGSTDGTLEVALRWAREHANIQVFSQANAGQSAARNFLIDRAETNFITFVDADDVILPDGLRQICAVTDEDVDIVFSNRKVFHDSGKHDRYSKLFRNMVRGRVSDLKNPRGIMAPHGKLFRCAFLRKHSIHFPVGIVWEDVSFTYETCLRAEIVSSTRFYTYGWRKRSGENRSTMQKLLTPHSLESRRQQIARTEALNALPEWRNRFGARWEGREFGHRMMMHLKALKRCKDRELRSSAFRQIRAIVGPYQTQIRARHDGTVLAMYEAIFRDDLDGFLRAARGYEVELAVIEETAEA